MPVRTGFVKMPRPTFGCARLLFTEFWDFARQTCIVVAPNASVNDVKVRTERRPTIEA